MPTPLPSAEFTAYATMKRAIVAIRLALGKRLRERSDLSLIQFEILLMLEQSPTGLRMHELAEAVGVSRSGLTYQVGQLEEAGWVERMGSPRHRRAVIATLTQAGRDHVTSMQGRHFDFVQERVFGLLEPEEIAIMTSVFQRIADHVTADDGADGEQEGHEGPAGQERGADDR